MCMTDITTFKRYELKYIMTKNQKQSLLALFDYYMNPDEYGKSSIFNLYYDTDNYLLIRRSLEKDIYKEKLRLRSYGKADHDTKVFLEIKKKFEDVVYKRRISLPEENATDYFYGSYELNNSQISKEIDYFKFHYTGLSAKMFIGYDREAFFGKDDSAFRVTFDENIIWRTKDLSLCSSKYGNTILPDNMVLMEIKVAGGIPLWLTEFLTQNKIFKTSFSKYGSAYEQMLLSRKEVKYAV